MQFWCNLTQPVFFTVGIIKGYIMAIQAVIFDLDGALVDTESLKAIAYARTVQELSPRLIPEENIIAVYKELVGLPQREVAVGLVKHFGLEENARKHRRELGVTTSWQVLVRFQLDYYSGLLYNPEIIRRQAYPHIPALLSEIQRAGFKIGLVSMSPFPQVQRILTVLQLVEVFDFIATREDVNLPKPDPEIYLLVAAELKVAPANTLVIEDSPTGIQAALAAGMRCIAVTTPFTRAQIHSSPLLDGRWIAGQSADLLALTRSILSEDANSTNK